MKELFALAGGSPVSLGSLPGSIQATPSPRSQQRGGSSGSDPSTPSQPTRAISGVGGATTPSQQQNLNPGSGIAAIPLGVVGMSTARVGSGASSVFSATSPLLSNLDNQRPPVPRSENNRNAAGIDEDGEVHRRSITNVRQF